MSNFTILPAVAEDASTLSQLVNSAYRGDTSRQGWTTEADLLEGTRTDKDAIEGIILRPGTVILKYTEENNIIGCVELNIQDSKLYLGMLTVEPGTQGRGVGKKLLKAAENYAHDKKCRSIYMTVISVRIELIDWYKRHGYRETGEKKPFNFGDTRFGIPKKKLEFVVLEKPVA